MDLTRRLEKALAGAGGETVTTATLYVVSAGVLFPAFHILLKRRLRHRKIGPKRTGWPQIRREAAHSLRSILVFGLATVGVLIAAGYGLTRLYGPVTKYGWWWVFVSVAL